MFTKSLAVTAAIVTFVAVQPAAARPHPRAHHVRAGVPVENAWGSGFYGGSSSEGSARHARRGSSERGASSNGRRSGLGPRPGAWCGWYMRSRHGGGPEYNLAANWRRYGSPASPQVGAIVVWSHHVGEIVGQTANGQWIVLSGNDSGSVRQRARSIAGAAVRI